MVPTTAIAMRIPIAGSSPMSMLIPADIAINVQMHVVEYIVQVDLQAVKIGVVDVVKPVHLIVPVEHPMPTMRPMAAMIGKDIGKMILR